MLSIGSLVVALTAGAVAGRRARADDEAVLDGVCRPRTAAGRCGTCAPSMMGV
jgi:hypothetical protein